MRTLFRYQGILGFFLVLFLFTIPAAAYSAQAVQDYEKGNSLILSGNFSDAITAYDRAIALEPGYFEAYNGKADALNQDGEFSEALKESSRCLDLNPGYVKGWINRGQILYNIGYYYEDIQKNQEKADEYYREQLLAFDRAVQLEPANAEAWFNKGYALAGMKRYDEAIAAFDKVESLDPAYPNLALSQKQARVLRDAGTPSYTNILLVVAGLLVLIILGGLAWLWHAGRSTAAPEKSAAENRQARRKNER
ncbi:MAG: tetratricopeptide repeat protein [Methanomicrobiales archaeon]|nr:tetratricopeptide repeat protein [Methanomicrobiales archaeon]